MSGLRNLKGSIATAPGLNILIGENGAGKTNWLEAIGILASSRSFRTVRLAEALAFGSETGTVSGDVRESPEIVRRLQVVVGTAAKTLLVNDKKETVQGYLGQLHAVVFTADELDIVRGQPEARRRFLDSAIVSLHPPFVQVFADYSRIVKQKNALLQQARDAGSAADRVHASVVPWNQQLASNAARIHRARLRIVERLNDALERSLFSREEIGVAYRSSLEGKGDLADYEALMNERLELRLQAEIAAGHCLVGPHRDDLEITFDGLDIRKFGSSGQQRSALLLLLLASIAVYNATRGEYPLFLIDDIDAELDYRRIGSLLEYLDGKTQTFVTTSKDSFTERFGARGRIFRVQAGAAEIQ